MFERTAVARIVAAFAPGRPAAGKAQICAARRQSPPRAEVRTGAIRTIGAHVLPARAANRNNRVPTAAPLRPGP
jgi:hypothetical protein